MDALHFLSTDELLERLPLSDFQALQDIQVFLRKNSLLKERLEQVSPLDFYMDIFPADSLERAGHPEDGKPNPIITLKRYNEEGHKSYFQNVLLFSDYMAVQEAQGADFAICSLCSYSGRKKTAKNAYKLHGICIDLDGVGVRELESFFEKVKLDMIPCPSYLVNSGHGLHVYYIFPESIPLYPKVVPILQRLKRGLTYEVWDRETSAYKTEDRQFQGIYQGFRVVGSKTKMGSNLEGNPYTVTAFKYGGRVDLATLSHYVDEQFAVPAGFDIYGSGFWEEEHLSLEKAKSLFPDWYEKRIVQKLPKGQYVCNEGLYTWWKTLISSIEHNDTLDVKDGNRYWCIATLFIYAIKCNVAFETVWKDAEDLIQKYDSFTVRESNHFTLDDVIAAASFYDAQSAHISKKFIAAKTKVKFPERKRKKIPKNESSEEREMRIEQERRMMEANLVKARFLRSKNYDMVGRPTGSSKQKKLVQDWRKENPNGTPKQCIEAHKAPGDTHLSRNTVYRWWNV